MCKPVSPRAPPLLLRLLTGKHVIALPCIDDANEDITELAASQNVHRNQGGGDRGDMQQEREREQQALTPVPGHDEELERKVQALQEQLAITYEKLEEGAELVCEAEPNGKNEVVTMYRHAQDRCISPQAEINASQPTSTSMSDAKSITTTCSTIVVAGNEADTPPPRPKTPPHPTRTASRRDAMKQIQEKRRKARAAEATVTAATRLDEGGTPALGKTMGQVTSSRPAVVSSPSRANRSGKEAAIARAREKRKVAMAAASVRRRLGSGGHDASDGMVGISDI